MRSRSIKQKMLQVAGALLIAAGVPVPLSVGAHAAHAAQVRIVRVSHDRFLAHAEPSVAVNPRNPRNLLGAAQLFGAASHTIGTFVSFDGGRTWHDNGPLPLPGGADWADDVTVAFDQRGEGLVAAMATKQTAQGLSQTDRGVYVWRTDDGGRTFGRPLAVESGHFADHPWLAAGASPEAPAAFYIAWSASLGSGAHRSSDVLAFSRSVDGGRHFSSPSAIATPAGGVLVPMVAAGPGRMVAVVYVEAGGIADAPDADSINVGVQAPAAKAGQVGAPIAVVRSTDGGQRFGHPVALAPSANLGVLAGPSVAIDPRRGTVYVAYADPQGAIAVMHAAAGSMSWSAPVHLPSGPPADHPIAFQPQVAVDGAGGVDVTFFSLAHGRIDVLLDRSTTHGADFPLQLRITPTTFNPALASIGAGGKHGPWWVGDYQGLAAWGTTLYPFWNDTRSGRLEIFAAAVSASPASLEKGSGQ